eukprot:Skav222136  [mRNA]  locus=scaffold1181:973586:979189:+ [translate_table: standard]
MSQIALDQCTVLSEIDIIDIFTDGSFHPAGSTGPAKGAWAFAIFGRGRTQHGQPASQWIGFYSGKTVDHLHPEHESKGLGIFEQSPYESERSALWWAAAYLLQRSDACPAHIHYDANAAGESAAGLASGSGHADDFGLGATLRGIFQLLCQHREVRFRHVKGHTGQAGNELADAIATAQCLDHIHDTTPSIRVSALARASKMFMQWAFAHSGANDRPHMGYNVVFPGFQPAETLPFSWRPGTLLQPTQVTAADLHLHIVSYNVMTTRKRGVINLLRQQLEDAQVHVAGFQETRDKQSKMWASAPYIRFCSEATPQGQGGLQLWVSTTLPFARSEGRPIFFQKKHFTVAMASPRLLIVHGHVSGLHLTFVVGHAPHSGDESAESWWDEFATELAKIPPTAHKIVMIDANARMQHFRDSSCGDWGADPHDGHPDCSDHFHQLLLEHELCLPSTFARYHTGDHATWSIGERAGARLDYIAIPQRWTLGTINSKIDHEIRSGVSNYDHKAVVMHCQLTIAVNSQRLPHRRPIDRNAMLTPEGRTTCQHIFNEMPQLPASTDPTIHCHVIEQYLSHAIDRHFRLDRRKKKKEHISQSTYVAILTHRDSRRQLRACFRWKDNTLRIRAFQAWASACGLRTDAPPCTNEAYASTLRCIDQGIQRLQSQARDTLNTLQHKLHQDKQVQLQQMCEQLEHTPPHAIWDVIKPVLPKHRRGIHASEHLPGLRDPHGFPVTSPQEVAALFQEHFAQAEGGSQHHPDDIVAIFLEAQQKMFKTECPSQLHASLSDIPTLQALEGKFRQIKKGKACGPDGLPGELFRSAPSEAAAAYFGLISKVTTFGADPLQWRGGIVKAIYKRGPTEAPSSWRNILLSSIPGKAAHSLVRDALNTCYQAYAHEGQFGGKAGASILVPTIGARSFQRWCKTQNRSYALLFVDGIEAFYRLVRELCFHIHDHDHFVKVTQQKGASPRLQELILTNAKALPALHRAQASDHLIHVTRGLHLLTWFVCEHEAHNVALTTCGSRPGDPVADVLFNLVMGRVMRQIEQKLQAEDLLESLPLHADQPLPLRCKGINEVHFSGQAWVDDLIFMTSSDRPEDLCPRIARITSIVQQELAGMGIQINLNQGKSEAIVHLAGRNSRQLRRDLHLHEGDCIRFENIEGEHRSLAIGQRYKYLGSILSIHGTCTADIKHRAGQTFAALKQLRQLIFRNRSASPQVKQLVLHSVVLSKMLATSGAWIFDTKQAEQCFHKTIMRIYRYVFALRPGWNKTDHHSHDEVISTLGVLTPAELLHVHRLRGLISAIKLGNAHIWALLQADQQWLQHAQDGLQWIAAQTSMAVGQATKDISLQEFIYMAEDNPGKARSLLRRGQRAALNQRLREHHVDQWHRKFSQHLEEAGFVYEPSSASAPDTAPEAENEGFLCPVCAKYFQSPHQTATHMMRAHNIHADHYLWSNRTSCLSCMQEFHTRKRLAAHFQHGGVRCLQQLKLRYQDPEIIADDQVHPHREHVPFLRVMGPVEPWCEQVVDEHRGWRHKPRRPGPVPLMPRATHTEEEQVKTRSSPFPNQLPSVSIPRHIPRPVQFVLHLFSGRRRPGDLQSHLEALASQLHHEVRVLSLDVAIDPTLGNLASAQAFDFWTDKALRGFVLSFLAGPPCETFTRSRFRQDGPPPLRSFLFRWGLPGLMGRQHRQVMSGNFLWQFSTSMILCQLISGKGGVFEHPAPYEINEGPCKGGIHTWAFPEVVTLLKWPTAQLHLVDQGRFGQRSKKPTGFWVANHPEASRIFKEMVLPPEKWCLTGITMGWDDRTRLFATAPLKEYPDRLNEALAHILLSPIASPPVTAQPADGAMFQKFVDDTSHLQVQLQECGGGSMQPDWHQG